MTFRINGDEVDVSVPPDTPLLYVLRNDLGLCGARFGCGQGLCGACTVLVDGRPMQSCDVPTWMVEGKDVRTIESLASGGALHPVQQAFLDEQAGQCGYCLSGIVMRVVALGEAEPRPTSAEILDALDAHLCRCGAHARILRAAERAVAVMQERAR